MTQRSANFRKHTFDIMGSAHAVCVRTLLLIYFSNFLLLVIFFVGTIDITESIRGALNLLAANASNLMPTTVLFVEIPTNPDMKVRVSTARHVGLLNLHWLTRGHVGIR